MTLKNRRPWAQALLALLTLQSMLTFCSCGTSQTHVIEVTVVPDGAGIIHPATGRQTNQEVLMRVEPAYGYRFECWSGDASGTSSTLRITLDENKTVTAHFSPILVTLDTYCNYPERGIIVPSGGEYQLGTSLTLEAIPNEGYRLREWAIDASGSTPTISISMDSDMRVGAIFVPDAESNDGREASQEVLPDFGSLYPTLPVLYSSDFSRDDSAWQTFTDFYGAASYDGGTLRLESTYYDFRGYPTRAETIPLHYGVVSALEKRAFTDFAVEVTISTPTAPEGQVWSGLMVEGCNSREDRYLAISQYGEFAVFKPSAYSNNYVSWATPRSWAPYINSGSETVNVMRIECADRLIRIFVNEHPAEDVTLHFGECSRGLSLFVYAPEGSGGTANFDSIVVYDLASALTSTN